MKKKFRDLASRTMTVEQRARAANRARALLTEMSLSQLRKARELSQLNMAEKLKTTQSSISRLEHQADMYLSTLREYVEASGGHLELIARYRDTEIRLTQFADLASA
jgi:DNA-directed RNA polymerase specialized sigma subunit